MIELHERSPNPAAWPVVRPIGSSEPTPSLIQIITSNFITIVSNRTTEAGTQNHAINHILLPLSAPSQLDGPHQYYYNFNSMRLQFQLNKIKIDPVCHVQLLRHAEEFQQRTNIYGQLYGALLDDEAEVTSVMPLPDGEKTTKEELEAMEKRNDDLLTTFNQDSEKIGWYLVCYTRNFWDSLETIKYYENYINTSFFLVFDFKSRLQGQNPYRAFRLKDEFALKESFKWQDLQKTSLEQDNPFEEIPVEVAKNDLFELMMLFNKDRFLKGFTAHRAQHHHASTFDHIKQNIEEYLTAFEEREDVQKYLNENYLKPAENTKPEETKERTIPFNDYCQYIGQALKLDNYDRHFKQYLQDNEHYERLFEDTN